MKNCSFLHPSFLLLKSFCLRSNIKHEMQCFIMGEAPRSSSKYSAVCRIFSTLRLGVSSGDETLHLMLDKLLKRSKLKPTF